MISETKSLTSPGERTEAGQTPHCGNTCPLSRRSKSGERRRRISDLEVQGATRQGYIIVLIDEEESDGQLQAPITGRFLHVVGDALWGG